ncbi:7-cyano-7-deazaguanine synthase [Cupriavidus basilensis]
MCRHATPSCRRWRSAGAEAVGGRDLFFGANAVDYSGYPDCRPEYVSAYETLANLATKAGVEGDRLRVRADHRHDQGRDHPRGRTPRRGLQHDGVVLQG